MKLYISTVCFRKPTNVAATIYMIYIVCHPFLILPIPSRTSFSCPSSTAESSKVSSDIPVSCFHTEQVPSNDTAAMNLPESHKRIEYAKGRECSGQVDVYQVHQGSAECRACQSVLNVPASEHKRVHDGFYCTGLRNTCI